MKTAFIFINQLSLGPTSFQAEDERIRAWARQHHYGVLHTYLTGSAQTLAFPAMLRDARHRLVEAVIVPALDHVLFGRVTDVCEVCTLVDAETEEVIPLGTVRELFPPEWPALRSVQS